MNSNTKQNRKKSNSFINSLLWWQLDKDEVQKQVSHYQILNIRQSARGMSFMLLIFSAIVTTLFILFFKWSAFDLIDAVTALVLGFLVYKGHRWASMAAMIYWTLERALTSFSLLSIVYWAIFMHTFYLTYKVEQLKNTYDVKHWAQKVHIS